MFNLFIICSFLLAPIIGQVTFTGRCPKVLVANPFVDFGRYQGNWYEIERYFFLPEIGAKCQFAQYKHYERYGENNGRIAALIGQSEKLGGAKLLTTWHGNAESYDGKSLISLKADNPVPLTPATVQLNWPFFVLDTDYKTYAIEWFCKEGLPFEGAFNQQTLWIMSRTRSLSPATRHHIHSRLKRLGINPKYLIQSDQTHCPRVPNMFQS